MISKTELKCYGWNKMSEYYNHIIESEINGQYKQFKSLINDLSKSQKHDFYDYVADLSYYDGEKMDNLIKEFLK